MSEIGSEKTSPGSLATMNTQSRTATASPKGRVAEFDADLVQRISEAVYRTRLCDESGEGADLRMIEKDKDSGEKLKNRARAYDVLTRAYMREIPKATMSIFTEEQQTKFRAQDALYDETMRTP